MRGILIIGLLLVAVVARAEESLVFDFESGALPANSLAEGAWEAGSSDPGVLVALDEAGTRAGQVCLTGDEAKGGLFLRAYEGDESLLRQGRDEFTVSLAVRAGPVSASPVFFERLSGGSSQKTGLMRFRSQGNSGDDHGRKGTLRFYVRDENGEMRTATSTVPWQQAEGVWHQVAFVFSAGSVTFYLDGERLGDPVDLGLARIPDVPDPTSYVRVGYGFKGSMDDLVILPGKALSEDQIRTLHQDGVKAVETLGLLR